MSVVGLKPYIDMGRPVQRTCVGCRTVHEKQDLIRLAVDATGDILVDSPHARGRGAYLCLSLLCLTQALQRKALSRALRRELAGVDQAAVGQRVEAAIRRRGIA
jgi:predicted RNA-binding protein YlxR (DUF448 family)